MKPIEAITAGDLGSPLELRVPSPWYVPVREQAREASLAQLRSMASVFERGGESLTGLYRRLCSHVRDYELDAPEVKRTLKEAGMPKTRISELVAVAYADAETWARYQSRAIGFRVALEETRRARAEDMGKPGWKARQWRRAAARVIRLVEKLGWKPEGWEYRLRGMVLRVTEVNITNSCNIGLKEGLPYITASDSIRYRSPDNQ